MKLSLPLAPSNRVANVSCDISPSALDRWDHTVRAAKDEPDTISIFDVIGSDPWTGEGTTAKRISGALRSIGDKPVVVNINSPGGDMFEGLAIYNLLREHKGEVTVRVLGVAASAASVIAMGADKVQIARSAFLMIHNAWVVAVGNRHDMRAMADTLEPFDRAMADIYAARTGEEMKAIGKLMDSETWIGGSDAVDQGFADSLLDSDDVSSDPNAKSETFAARKVERALAQAGLPRSERKRLISELKASARDAAGEIGERDASDVDVSELLSLSQSLKGILK
jgi:ATP-dependent protease ClpP protease subunit